MSAVAVAPDSNWLASVGADQTVRVWHAATGETGALMRTEQPGSACAWTRDSRSLAVAGATGLYLFQFHPGKLAADPGRARL